VLSRRSATLALVWRGFQRITRGELTSQDRGVKEAAADNKETVKGKAD